MGLASTLCSIGCWAVEGGVREVATEERFDDREGEGRCGVGAIEEAVPASVYEVKKLDADSSRRRAKARHAWWVVNAAGPATSR